MRKKDKKRLGLVLGRFQPLHPGHLKLIDKAFKENDKVVICIGSAQNSKPFSIEERHKRIDKQLKILKYQKYRIVDLKDIEDKEAWPSYLKNKCKITENTINTFYKADKLEEDYIKNLEKIGFRVVIVKRKKFYYKAPDGFYRLISSASEIRRLNKKSRKKKRRNKIFEIIGK